MTIAIGQVVEHRHDLALGQGRVLYVQEIAGVTQVGVSWTSSSQPAQHTLAELAPLRSLPERLRDVGPASRVPFQLKVLGRWFEARHALTGELSNQPFQMLPHQVLVTNRVVNSAPDQRAWLIADDVGLGKTIEAGMIIEVLRRKSLGRFRCLIVTPAGLMPQWQEELARRFGRSYRQFESRIATDLEDVDQLVASIDTLKMAKFRPALEMVTPWDLVIFDEAHHLATSTNVLAYQLAQALRSQGKARNVLFLTATPHSGNHEHFFNMLRILREDLFPKGAKNYPNVPLKQLMIRNRKSDVTDAKRERIFKGIAPAKIIPFVPTAEEVTFYEDLRKYLKSGYRAAERLQREKEGQSASAVGFLMSTFGKLASSSRAAIATALNNRRLALLGESGIEPKADEGDARFPGEREAQQVATLGIPPSTSPRRKKKESLIEGELAQVEKLVSELANLDSLDTKLSSFIERVTELPKDLKLLIFTEYRATQNELVEALTEKFGTDSVVTINGSMRMPERVKNVSAFNEQRPNPLFMVSTEAGGEGLNMQKSCHTVVNYDLPWNPMVLQQRIGRVYRYGQGHPVVVFNLKVDSSSEAFADQRVYAYLETKIDEITEKLKEVQDGEAEDLRDEVLGQVSAQLSFGDLYKTAVEEGHRKAEKEIDSKVLAIEQILADPDGMLGLFRGLDRFDITAYDKVAARVSAQHLEFFVRQYLGHTGATIKTHEGLMTFDVPKRLVEVANQLAKTDRYQARDLLGASRVELATVDKDIAQSSLKSRLLRFGDPVFEAMVRHVQHGGFAEGVASLELPSQILEWPSGAEGTWLLFDLRVVRQEGSQGGARVLRHELASFVVPRGEPPTARDDLVDRLNLATDGPATVDHDEALRAYTAARSAADTRLTVMYQELVAEFGTANAILPQQVQDVAMAWLQAV